MTLEKLNQIKVETAKKMVLRNEKHGYKVLVSMGTCGLEHGAREVLNALADEAFAHEVYDAAIYATACMGDCSNEPMVKVVSPSGEECTYAKVSVKDAKEIIEQHVIGGKPVARLVK